MELEAALIAPESAKHAVLWPLPPFFRLAAPLLERHAWACVVELLNGYTIIGDLQSFEPRQGTIILAMADQEGHHQLNLETVRTIRLTAPLVLVRDTDVISGVGTDVKDVADERGFVVRFRDGKTLTGITRGFIKEEIGLFLYLLEGEPPQATRCFVPAQQLGDVQIGPLLGDTLLRKKQISGAVLTTALNKQTMLRQEKLGQHLLNHGIVSPDELKRALQSQRYRPTTKLGALLLEAGLITSEQLAEALRLQGANRRRHLGDILVEMGAVTVRQIHMALADKLGIPFVNVVNSTSIQRRWNCWAPVATRYRALPLVPLGDSLVVAVEDPLAMDFVQDLRFLTGKIIVPVVADPADLRRRIAKEYASLALSIATVEADRIDAGPRRVPVRGTAMSMLKNWRVRSIAGNCAADRSPRTTNPIPG
jgi:hypothetical protein